MVTRLKKLVQAGHGFVTLLSGFNRPQAVASYAKVFLVCNFINLDNTANE